MITFKDCLRVALLAIGIDCFRTKIPPIKINIKDELSPALKSIGSNKIHVAPEPNGFEFTIVHPTNGNMMRGVARSVFYSNMGAFHVVEIKLSGVKLFDNGKPVEPENEFFTAGGKKVSKS